MVLDITLQRKEIEQAIKDFIIDAIPTTMDKKFDFPHLPIDLRVTVMEKIKEVEPAG